MNTRTFLKTSLGSLAALSLPFNAQAAPLTSLTGIKSEFAFGGEFKFGELSLYVHKDQEAMNDFFAAIRKEIPGTTFLSSCKGSLRNFLLEKGNKFNKFLIFQDVSPDDVGALKQFLKENPKHIALCAHRKVETGHFLGTSNTQFIFAPDNIYHFQDIHPGMEVTWGPAYIIKPFKTRGKSKELGMCFSKDNKGIKFVSNIHPLKSI